MIRGGNFGRIAALSFLFFRRSTTEPPVSQRRDAFHGRPLFRSVRYVYTAYTYLQHNFAVFSVADSGAGN
jgi:hypothetical protein